MLPEKRKCRPLPIACLKIGAMDGVGSIDYQARSSHAQELVFPELSSWSPIEVLPVARSQHSLFLDARFGNASRVSCASGLEQGQHQKRQGRCTGPEGYEEAGVLVAGKPGTLYL